MDAPPLDAADIGTIACIWKSGVGKLVDPLGEAK